ncbi:MAG: hypothetical protein Q4G50_00120 [Corynebacterium sp.]|uniref:hypothetical protein n=1 Tax=Corynebacterium sp. TaxID=1720 RepID=UPI0026E0BCF1|nr:hypothetical protein [Corynebacterium sp.]MDO5668393.1 hypothetical protein [Corynebacterium sp.]
MEYQGARIDGLIAEGLGRIVVKDGSTLDSRGLITPKPLREVTLSSATHLAAPLEDPAVTAQVHKHYHRVTRDYVIARNRTRPNALSAFTAQFHPRGMRYVVNAATRAVAHLAERPSAVASHFSAAALLGITDFADDADSSLLGPYSRTITSDVQLPTVRRAPVNLPTWTLHLGERQLKVTPPMLTLAHCLRVVLSNEHAWRTPAGMPHAATTVRAVQLIDRFRREFGLAEKEVAEGLRGLVDKRKLGRILALSDGGADSPPETLVRLIARHAVPELEWQSQVTVLKDGTIGDVDSDPATILTVLDLAAIAERRFVYYDGDHHLDRAQRDKDSHITAQLTAWGWGGIRVTAGMIDAVHQLNAHLRALSFPESRAA